MRWVIFHIVIVFFLILDLFFLQGKDTPLKRAKKALIWSLFWIVSALAFGLFIYLTKGQESALEFITAYAVEKSLSVDNLFVFFVIFQSFRVPQEKQKTILYIGLISAMIMRLILIITGYALVEQYGWVLYALGGFLVFTGIRLFISRGKVFDWHMLPWAAWIKKKYINKGMFAVFLLIESSDVLFALDSIPAVFSITTDLYIAYTSNVFAILGLRALYILLSSYLDRLRYLKPGLALVLIFIGTKKLISPIYSLSTGVSLIIVFFIFILSWFVSSKKHNLS